MRKKDQRKQKTFAKSFYIEKGQKLRHIAVIKHQNLKNPGAEKELKDLKF